MFWGFSPAVNVYDEIPKSSKKVLNILLIGSKDPRHILKTISKAYKHDQTIKIFVVEKCLEQVARHILLLNIALEQKSQLSLFEKTRFYMEVFGNIIIRPSVSKYIMKKSKQLIEVVTNCDYCYKTMPIFDLSLMNHKEIDYLENLLKFWSKPCDFDILDAWDKRLRKTLGVRYDSKHGVFDWDYYMKISDLPDGKKIFSKEYTNWRKTGIAFQWIEHEGSKPNVSMITGILINGDKKIYHGYLGDITIGPYICFGIKSEFEKNELEPKITFEENENSKRATDTTEMNLMNIIYEAYEKKENDNLNKITEFLGRKNIVESVTIVDINPDQLSEVIINKHFEPLINLPNVKIKFLSHSSLNYLKNKSLFRNLFNMVIIGNDFLNFSEDWIVNLNELLTQDALIYIESKRFLIVDIQKDHVQKWADDVIKHFTELNGKYQQLNDFKWNENDFIKFIFN